MSVRCDVIVCGSVMCVGSVMCGECDVCGSVMCVGKRGVWECNVREVTCKCIGSERNVV